MNLTAHLTLDEFQRTSKYRFKAENYRQSLEFVDNISKVALELEKPRMFTGRPVIVTSGFRCPALNKAVKGSPTSQHMNGSAADFRVKDYMDSAGMRFIFDWCSHHIEYGQLILERPAGKKPWIHFGLPREGQLPTRFVFDGSTYQPV